MSGKSLGTGILYVFYTVGINFRWEGKAACLLHFFLSCVCPLLTGCSQQDWCCTESSGWAQGEQKVLVEKDQNLHHVAWHRTFKVELDNRGVNPTSNFCYLGSLAFLVVNFLLHRVTRKMQNDHSHVGSVAEGPQEGKLGHQRLNPACSKDSSVEDLHGSPAFNFATSTAIIFWLFFLCHNL